MTSTEIPANFNRTQAGPFITMCLHNIIVSSRSLLRKIKVSAINNCTFASGNAKIDLLQIEICFHRKMAAHKEFLPKRLACILFLS